MEDQYPRLTEMQVEQWLNDPVTQYLLECFDWQIKDLEAEVNSGACRSSDNNLTCMYLDLREGQKNGMRVAGDPLALFKRYELMELPKEEVEDEAA